MYTFLSQASSRVISGGGLAALAVAIGSMTSKLYFTIFHVEVMGVPTPSTGSPTAGEARPLSMS